MTERERLWLSYFEHILNFAGVWDSHGLVSLKSPYSYETVARIALDFAHVVVKEAKAEGKP